MSDAYLKEFGNRKVSVAEKRKFFQRPGRMDEDGNPIYFTEQHHKKECDVNEIIKKYDRTGVITHVSKIEGRFGDMTGMDFQAMQNKVAKANSMFEQLPYDIKKRFNQSPAELLTFMESADNRAEAIKLGLIDPQWTEETDGLGEHVEEGKNVKKKTAETSGGASEGSE